jgi:hypothetical protein
MLKLMCCGGSLRAQARMAAAAPQQPPDDDRKRAAAAAGMAMAVSAHWFRTTLRFTGAAQDVYSFRPNAAPYFEWMLTRQEEYRALCRLTVNETEALAQKLQLPLDRSAGKGHWKYPIFHRFVAFLMSIADYTRFKRLAFGTPQPFVFAAQSESH